MSVFIDFAEFVEPYKFLKLTTTSNGYKIEEEIEAEGIYKLIEGKTESDAMEQATSDAVIKVKYDESFTSDNMVGHGIAITDAQGERTYRIEGQSLAQDRDFYNLTLTREDLWDESPSPLE